MRIIVMIMVIININVMIIIMIIVTITLTVFNQSWSKKYRGTLVTHRWVQYFYYGEEIYLLVMQKNKMPCG